MKKLVLSLLLVLMVGCCSPDAASALKDAIAINKGHMVDESLPEEARAIAQDNYDFDYDVLYRLGAIEKLPDDVRKRKDARGGGK